MSGDDESFGSKLKSFFSGLGKKDPADDPRFKGTGRKLGSAAPPPQPAAHASQGAQASGRLAQNQTQAAAGHRSSPVALNASSPRGPAQQPPAARPGHILGGSPTTPAASPGVRSSGATSVPASASATASPAGLAPAALQAGPFGGRPQDPAASSPGPAAATTTTQRAGSGPAPGPGQGALQPQPLTPFGGPQGGAVGLAGAHAAAPSANTDELEHCLALVLSCGEGGGAAAAEGGAGGGGGGSSAGARECCEALQRILRNVVACPGEAKYRRIRLSNPKVQQTVVGVPGAVEFLEAAGFRMEFAHDDGSEGSTQSFLVLPDEVPGAALAEPLHMLSSAMLAHGLAAPPPGPGAEAASLNGASMNGASVNGASLGVPSSSPAARAASGAEAVAGAGVGAGSAAASFAAGAADRAAALAAVPAIARDTQVILPATPDVHVPDWFFERTGAEIKAQWLAALGRRQQGEQFMTKAMRDRMGQHHDAPPPNVASVRVRFPEGVCLQGLFGAAEPVSRVFEWVASCLRSPATTFELIRPDRKPLAVVGVPAHQQQHAGGKPGSARGAGAPQREVLLSVGGADLLPSVLLNLRPTGHVAGANVPLLSDALLATTRAQ